MLEVVAPGELDQPRDRLDRRRVEEAQRLLCGADAGVRMLQHREEEALLVAEVVVEHPLVRAGPARDAVDSRAPEPEARELLRGGVEDAAARALGVARAGLARRAPGASPSPAPRASSVPLRPIRATPGCRARSRSSAPRRSRRRART